MSEATQVPAQVMQDVTVNVRVTVNDHTYVLMIPAGVPFEEAYVVALEMSSVIKKMQEQAKSQAEQPQGEADGTK